MFFSKRTIAMLIASSFVAAQAGASANMTESSASPRTEYHSLSGMSEDSFPHTLTVFNPDGTSYSLVAYDVALEPELIVMTDQSLPDQLTVFDPDGSVTSYEFIPLDVAYLEPSDLIAAESDTPVILVEVAEPVIVAMTDGDTLALADEETGNDYVVWFDEDGTPRVFPSYIA